MEDMCINPTDHSFTLLCPTRQLLPFFFCFIYLRKCTWTKNAWQSTSQNSKEIMIHKIYKEEINLGNICKHQEKEERNNHLMLQHDSVREIKARQGPANATGHWLN